MVYVAAQFSVKDYKSWRMVFDKHSQMRKSAGEVSVKILRTEEDPNDINLLFEWDNSQNARSFLTSPEAQQGMRESGMNGKPQMRFLTEIA